MEFSLFYFANDSRVTSDARYELLLEGARFADQNDFSAVWTPERHFHPFGGLYPNPAVTGAAVAAVTSRVQIRAGSIVSPLHNPLRIAEEWSMVDNLSGGRAGISFGSGWNAADFVLAPDNYQNRRQIVGDHVEQVRRLWLGGRMTLTDGVGTRRDVAVYPPPVQKYLPAWLTSSGSAETFRMAGQLRTGILTHLLGQEQADLAGKLAMYRRTLAEHDDDGWPGHVVLMVHAFLGEDEAVVKEQVRAPLCEYLRSSLDLSLGARYNGAPVIDPKNLTPSDVDFLVERAFDRYFDHGALLGTVEKAERIAASLRDLGVDEIACLIDFGLTSEAVLGGLKFLNELRLRLKDS
jgi:natural product biosynthesis luciferase-like monooxygenase protein